MSQTDQLPEIDSSAGAPQPFPGDRLGIELGERVHRGRPRPGRNRLQTIDECCQILLQTADRKAVAIDGLDQQRLRIIRAIEWGLAGEHLLQNQTQGVHVARCGRGLAAGLFREVPITEYSPKKIKMAITGNGNASKEQVAGMLQNLLKIETLPKNLDSTDGLAAAVCHFFNQGRSNQGKQYSGWDAFVRQNKDRIE